MAKDLGIVDSRPHRTHRLNGERSASARFRKRRLRHVACAVALGACTHREGIQGAPHERRDVRAVTSVDAGHQVAHEEQALRSDAGSATNEKPPCEWRDAVVRERWMEAWNALHDLPIDERSRPEARFVMARSALATGHQTEVEGLLEHLERDLPFLRAELEQLRAQALPEAPKPAGPPRATEAPKHARNAHAAPRPLDAERLRALAYLRRGEGRLARPLCERLGARGSNLDRARWEVLAGRAADQSGDHASAIDHWRRAIERAPLSWPALVASARLGREAATFPSQQAPPPASPAPPVQLPEAVVWLQRVGLDGDAERALRRREDRITAAASGRGTEALCRAYGMVGRGARRLSVAMRIADSLVNAAPSEATRWAWECMYPTPFRAEVAAGAQAAGVDPNLVWATMRQESAFEPDVVSPARAVGLMQLLPETAQAMANAPLDAHELARPETNIRLGARYVRSMLDRFGGNVVFAVAAYNAGPEAVERWRTSMPGLPLEVLVESIPFSETRGYVVRVLGNLARYGFLERGESGIPSIALDPDTR